METARYLKLAERMAGMTRVTCDLIVGTLEHEKEQGWLHDWLAAFRETLIPDLDVEQFADMFAQTLAYGLFAARVHAPPGKPFSRELAAYNLPKTNPFLRKLFSEIAGVDMPDSIAWAVDDVVNLLRHADMAEVLSDFGKGKDDPVVHFYETFLAAYDPKMREIRGVYYTPEPVVGYIVRSVDHLLKTRFNRPKGLADEKTLILDPACGTGTFLHSVIGLIHQRFASQRGAWDGYVAEHLLNRVFGFELLMAPYAVAHLKLGMQLQRTGYQFRSDQRLGIYLTNTLEEAAKRSEHLFAAWVADEANAAAEIKGTLPIVVVTGNPPYSASMSEGRWILSLIADYRKGLKEKKADLKREEWKFLRFAQWRIEKTGYGVVAFVINNSFLDAITHRRMRECLLQSFSEIYVLDLHGSVMGKKKSPDGMPDQNVFDIEQGVAIALFVKGVKEGTHGLVYHHDLWGARQDKYDFLLSHDISSTDWTTVQPRSPEYFFLRTRRSRRAEYENFWRLPSVFPKYSSGIQTKKDRLAVQFDPKTMLHVVKEFVRQTPESARARFGLGSDSGGWSIERAIADVREAGVREENVVPLLYRPFDVRFTYYTGKSSGFHGRPRREIMRHLLAGENLGLISMRQIVGEEHNHFLATRIVNCHGTLHLGNRGQDYLFPLYLYPDGALPPDLFMHEDGRVPNLSARFVADVTKRLGVRFVPDGRGNLRKTVGPEDVFHYAYAVFYSPAYRTRYAEFLKIDFPRLPLAGDLGLFRVLAAMGAELVGLHLLESPKLDEFLTTWPVKGDDVVERVEYAETDQRVWINKSQFFGGVPKAVWDFHVGGYQVCHKWLKDRKGRKLTYEDTRHYQRIIVALNETIRLMGEIDEAIDRHGGWPIR
jgi:predicted helicase